MKWFSALTLLLCLVACASHRQSSSVASDLSSPARSRFESVATSYPADSERARCAQFLLANMPAADLWSMSAKDFRENIEYACTARQHLPWGKSLPWEIFLHYVLPHRGSQEPFQPHRAALFKTLAPLCASASSIEEALSRVGSWCARQAEYRPTSRRDLGIQSILDGGFGRCEETNILFQAAARAVCLPVRQAMVPWWQHADGNHAWIEAWTPGGWKFLESGTEFSEPGNTWFASQRSRMPRVVAAVYGHPEDRNVYRTGAGYALVDSTANYTPTRRVQVRVTNATSPAPGQDVFFSVYSMGGLRPVAKAATDADGYAAVTLGPGTFFVSASAEKGLTWLVSDFADSQSADLDCAHPRPWPTTVHLHYPPPLSDHFRPLLSEELKIARANRPKKWTALLRTLPKNLAAHLATAGDTIPAWLRLIDTAGPHPFLIDYLLSLDTKDLLQANPDLIPDEIVLARQARAGQAAQGLRYDDDMFRTHVLSQRLYQEPWSAWRTELWPWLRHVSSSPLRVQLAAIKDTMKACTLLSPDYFGPPLTPGQVLTSESYSNPRDAMVFAAAALRTLGIPARLFPDFEMVEYFDGSTWQRWDSPADAPPMGSLHVCSAGKPVPDFALAAPQGGYLRTLDDVDWTGNATDRSCTLPAGTYILLDASRTNDQTEVRFQPVPITAGTNSTITLETVH